MKAAIVALARLVFCAALAVSGNNAVAPAHADSIAELKQKAEQGNQIAQYKLGSIYYSGEGVTRDGKEAVKWYRLAAEQGHADAQGMLGQMYSNGDLGTVRNRKEGIKWYRLAAEQGHAISQNNLGFKYKEGEGVPQNSREAVKWFRLAAEQGLSLGVLGSMYEEGKGVPQNYFEAYIWYSLAVANGSENYLDDRKRMEEYLKIMEEYRTSSLLSEAQDEAVKRMEAIEAKRGQ